MTATLTRMLNVANGREPTAQDDPPRRRPPLQTMSAAGDEPDDAPPERWTCSAAHRTELEGLIPGLADARSDEKVPRIIQHLRSSK